MFNACLLKKPLKYYDALFSRKLIENEQGFILNHLMNDCKLPGKDLIIFFQIYSKTREV